MYYPGGMLYFIVAYEILVLVSVFLQENLEMILLRQKGYKHVSVRDVL